eukprot:6049598-Alexandrium_andersonii.AAC.1
MSPLKRACDICRATPFARSCWLSRAQLGASRCLGGAAMDRPAPNSTPTSVYQELQAACSSLWRFAA